MHIQTWSPLTHPPSPTQHCTSSQISGRPKQNKYGYLHWFQTLTGKGDMLGQGVDSLYVEFTEGSDSKH